MRLCLTSRLFRQISDSIRFLLQCIGQSSPSLSIDCIHLCVIYPKECNEIMANTHFLCVCAVDSYLLNANKCKLLGMGANGEKPMHVLWTLTKAMQTIYEFPLHRYVQNYWYMILIQMNKSVPVAIVRWM